MLKGLAQFRFYLINYFVFAIGFGFNLAIGLLLGASASANYFLLLSVALPFLGVLFYLTNYPSSDKIVHHYNSYISSIIYRKSYITIIYIVIGLVVFAIQPKLSLNDLWIVPNIVLFEFFCQIERLKLQYNDKNIFKSYALNLKICSVAVLLVFPMIKIYYIAILLYNGFAILAYLIAIKSSAFIDSKREKVEFSSELLIVGAINSFSMLLLNKYLMITNISEIKVVVNNLLIRFISVFSIGWKAYSEKYIISSYQTKYSVQYVFILIITLSYFIFDEYPGYIFGAVSFTTSVAKLDFVNNFLHKSPKYILFSSLFFVVSLCICYLLSDDLYMSIIIGYIINSFFIFVISFIKNIMGKMLIMFNIFSLIITLLCII